MALSNDGKNEALDALGALARKFSLHSADPGTTGTSEIAGGAPAYARQDGAWNPAAAGVLSMAAGETFNVPGGNTTVSHFGVWSSDGLTFYGGGALSAIEVFASQGTYTLTNATITLT